MILEVPMMQIKKLLIKINECKKYKALFHVNKLLINYLRYIH